LLSSSKPSRVPEDSKSLTFPSVGLHPHTWPKYGCDKSSVDVNIDGDDDDEEGGEKDVREDGEDDDEEKEEEEAKDTGKEQEEEDTEDDDDDLFEKQNEGYLKTLAISQLCTPQLPPSQFPHKQDFFEATGRRMQQERGGAVGRGHRDSLPASSIPPA